jgi:hypothetical protein
VSCWWSCITRLVFLSIDRWHYSSITAVIWLVVEISDWMIRLKTRDWSRQHDGEWRCFGCCLRRCCWFTPQDRSESLRFLANSLSSPWLLLWLSRCWRRCSRCHQHQEAWNVFVVGDKSILTLTWTVRHLPLLDLKVGNERGGLSLIMIRLLTL